MEEQKPSISVPSSVISRLEITAIALALACAVLYVHGIAFHRAYLTSFGLSADAFPLSTDGAMMRGFEAYFLTAVRGLAWFLSTSIIVIIGIVAVWFGTALGFDWIMSRPGLRRMGLRLEPWVFYMPGEKPSRQPLTEIALKLGMVLVLVLLVFSLIGATAVLAGDTGRRKAQLVREACRVAGPSATGEMVWGISAPTVLVQYEQPGSLTLAEAKGCIIATATPFIALYVNSTVVTIPNARVVAITAQTH